MADSTTSAADPRHGRGYDLPDLRPQRIIANRLRLVNGAIVTNNGSLTTQDFVPGTGMDGWYLGGDGLFEFGGGVFRGAVVASSFSTDNGPGGEHVVIDASDSYGSVQFYSGDAVETLPGIINHGVSPAHGAANLHTFIGMVPAQTVEAFRPVVSVTGKAQDNSRQAGVGIIASAADRFDVIDVVGSTSTTSIFVASSGGMRVNVGRFGIFATPPVPKQTGVPVTAAGIHAALTAYGWIS